MRAWIKSIFIVGFVASGCVTNNNDNAGLKKEIRDENKALILREESGPRKRLIVLPFLDVSEIRGTSEPLEAREKFIRDLNKTGAVIALDSKDLKIDLSKASKTGEYDFSVLAPQAQSLGAHALMEGKLLSLKVKHMSDPVGLFRQVKSQFEATARVRIYMVRSAREIFNTVKTVTLEEGNVRVGEKVQSDRFLTNNPELVQKMIKEAFLDFVPQVVSALEKTNWEGRVAMVQGDRIFLNVGKISGVQIGDLLKVTAEGDEIFDPQSGNYIGKTPGRMKGTLEVVSYFGQDGAIAVIHSGSGFKENDRVELY